MHTVLNLLSIVFSLIGVAGGIWILIEAFKVSVAQGLLSLCVPCYILYFLFGVLDHPQKSLMAGMFLGGNIIGGVLNGIAQSGGL